MNIKETLEIFNTYGCRYLRRQGIDTIQGSVDSINWVNIEGKSTPTSFISTHENELDFVDDDIKKYFKQPPAKEGFSTMANSYFKGTPSLMQLVKEIRILNINLEKQNAAKI